MGNETVTLNKATYDSMNREIEELKELVIAGAYNLTFEYVYIKDITDVFLMPPRGDNGLSEREASQRLRDCTFNHNVSIASLGDSLDEIQKRQSELKWASEKREQDAKSAADKE